MAYLDDLYRLDHYNDTFALGHYARVLDALDRRSGQMVAFKVLRPEHLSPDGDMRWEFRAFANEADLLNKMVDSPYIVNLIDCGYLSDIGETPVGGEIESFQKDVMGFIQALPKFAERGWRPYLALQNLPRIHNLLYLMKPNSSAARWRLPSEEGLALGLQFGELLRVMHQRNIVYLDHKLEHVYWDGSTLRVIDLNSSRLLDPNSSASASQKRTDVHNLCVGILYPIFTGMSPQKTALRPQPGNQSEAEGRYSDINGLDFGIEPGLSAALQELLQLGAAQKIDSAADLITGLQNVATLHGWDFPNLYTEPACRDIRDQMKAGIQRLRHGQTDLREARDLFREAAIQDGINPDLSAELRRLVKAVNDMLNSRVIP